MACISDEYYDTVLRGCRQCSLVCDPPYSSSGKNEECTANCPSYTKTDAPVIPAMGPLGYTLIALAVVAVISIVAAIIVIIVYRNRLHGRRSFLNAPVYDNKEHPLVFPIPETGAPDPCSSPGIPLPWR